jgi:two-component system, NarL family, response regulator LiaR
LAKRFRIVLVEDHALTRVGLRTALTADPEIEVVGEAADGLEGQRVIEQTKPDVVVLDIGLPGIDGIELTRRVRSALPATRIVILTIQDLDSEILAALAAGADAYCVKASEPSGVITAVKVAAEGGAYFDPSIAHVVLRALGSPKAPAAPKDSPLTPRELEILRLISDGIGNAEIGERLHLGLGTVKGHVRDILEKMSASDRTQAAVNALRRGLI